MNLTKTLAVIGGWTVLSRITGLFREMLVARYLGAGLISDAFFVAFRFPNLFRSLFAEGAFNAAFVPLFTSKLTGEGKEAARDFAEQCLSVLGFFLLFFVALGEISMPFAMKFLAPGFDDVPSKMELAIELSRITFPYLFFIALVSLQSGVLNATGRFAAAAGTPVLLNIIAIVVLVTLAPWTKTPGHAMAWGVFASGIAQFCWLVHSVRKADMTLRPVWPHLSPEVKLMLRRVGPGAVGAGVYQVNLVINTMIASGLANGTVSYLNYADRVNQLPLGVVGIAMGTALLPLLSKQLRSGENEAAIESQNRGMELSLFLTLPAALAFMVLAHPIISVLFERGSFSATDTMRVAEALIAFATGLPAYVLVKVLAPGFFAREDTRTPIRIAIACMALNVVLNLILLKPFAHVGMAISTSLAAWANVGLLAWFLGKRGFLKPDIRLKQRIWRILFSSLLMSGNIFIAKTFFYSNISHNGFTQTLALATLVIIGIISYILSSLLTRAFSWTELRSMLRRS